MKLIQKKYFIILFILFSVIFGEYLFIVKIKNEHNICKKDLVGRDLMFGSDGTQILKLILEDRYRDAVKVLLLYDIDPEFKGDSNHSIMDIVGKNDKYNIIKLLQDKIEKNHK